LMRERRIISNNDAFFARVLQTKTGGSPDGRKRGPCDLIARKCAGFNIRPIEP
jgi:hypothetical protein